MRCSFQITKAKCPSKESKPLAEAAKLLGLSELKLIDKLTDLGFTLASRKGTYFLEEFPVGPPLVIEVMTSSTSGGNKAKSTTIQQAFKKAIRREQHQAPGINYRQIWARMVSQLIVKSQIPEYRKLHGGTLQALNPARGWMHAGSLSAAFSIYQSIIEVEDLAKEKSVVIPLQKKLPLRALGGDDYMVSQFPQQVEFDGFQLRRIVEAVKEEVLNWTIELEKRGILGEDMTFNEQEKRTATTQTFHIQQFSGVIGNVSNSKVEIYDFSSIHQTLKQLGISQAERNDLENIMDELGKAGPNEKSKLLERAKSWVVKNESFLGASIGLIRKALGLDTGPAGPG